MRCCATASSLVRIHRVDLTGAEEVIAASGLLIATTNCAFDALPGTMPGKVLHRIGDCVATRLAAYAFHEGRKLGMALQGRGQGPKTGLGL